MANRKRKQNESFKSYRLSLKREAYAIKVQSFGTTRGVFGRRKSNYIPSGMR